MTWGIVLTTRQITFAIQGITSVTAIAGGKLSRQGWQNMLKMQMQANKQENSSW